MPVYAPVKLIKINSVTPDIVNIGENSYQLENAKVAETVEPVFKATLDSVSAVLLVLLAVKEVTLNREHAC